jgi:hypothetical protein
MYLAYDGVTVPKIPSTARIVMGYIDGHYNNIDSVRARFPDAVIIDITVTGDIKAVMCDREKGDLTASEAAAYAVRRVKTLNKTATVYTSKDDISAVQQAVKDLSANAKLTRRQRKMILMFAADWTGQAHMVKGCVGTQFTNNPDYDISQIANRWPGVMEPMAVHRRLAMHVALGIKKRDTQLPPPDHTIVEQVMIATHRAVTLGH